MSVISDVIRDINRTAAFFQDGIEFNETLSTRLREIQSDLNKHVVEIKEYRAKQLIAQLEEKYKYLML